MAHLRIIINWLYGDIKSNKQHISKYGIDTRPNSKIKEEIAANPWSKHPALMVFLWLNHPFKSKIIMVKNHGFLQVKAQESPRCKTHVFPSKFQHLHAYIS